MSAPINSKDLERWLKSMEKRYRGAGSKALERAAFLSKTEATRAIVETKPYPPVDRGQMLRSYVVTRISKGFRLENIAPHAPTQEYGTAPFDPILSDLEEWAIRKARGGGVDPVILKWSARSAIRKRGIRAKGFHARASQRFPAIVRQSIVMELNLMAQRLR